MLCRAWRLTQHLESKDAHGMPQLRQDVNGPQAAALIFCGRAS
jgi:hypothetical protein